MTQRVECSTTMLRVMCKQPNRRPDDHAFPATFMDALVLAAGMGSRLREVELCKPLTLLHDLTLLEISVRQLVRAGATRVVVATGYRATEIEVRLPELAARVGVPVTSKRVKDYRQPNGCSVLAGASGFTGEFLLVMADHIFSQAVLAALVNSPRARAGAVLAVDRHVASSLVDPEDATWVALDDSGKIERIGKGIAEYDAVDCGAFRASPMLLDSIRAAMADGKPGSLSDGMQNLADRGFASTVDIGDAWWIDVDDRHALALARDQVTRHLPELFGPIDTKHPA